MGEDLALGLEAKQSSWAKKYDYVTSNGVDGDPSSIVETKRSTNPYWVVGFPKEEKIKGVVFINRVDCCGERFNNIHVMVGKKECATFKGPASNGEIIPLRCSHPLTGKKVEVKLKGKGILSFAEIEIIAANGRWKPGEEINVYPDRLQDHSLRTVSLGNLWLAVLDPKKYYSFSICLLDLKKKSEILSKIRAGNHTLFRENWIRQNIGTVKDAETDKLVRQAFQKNLKPDDFYAVLGKDVKPSERTENQKIGLKKVPLRADGYTTEQISFLNMHTTDEKGVDGNIKTIVHTKKQLNPWWIVDLTKNYKVKKIKVLSRPTKSGAYKDFKEVTALVGTDKRNMKECGFFKGPATRSQLITFNCKGPINGKFVKLQMKGVRILSFSEVQVYAIH